MDIEFLTDWLKRRPSAWLAMGTGCLSGYQCFETGGSWNDLGIDHRSVLLEFGGAAFYARFNVDRSVF